MRLQHLAFTERPDGAGDDAGPREPNHRGVAGLGGGTHVVGLLREQRGARGGCGKELLEGCDGAGRLDEVGMLDDRRVFGEEGPELLAVLSGFEGGVKGSRRPERGGSHIHNYSCTTTVVNVNVDRMASLDPASIDLPTLTALAGASANEYLLARVRGAGHESIRMSHGYVFQHLIGGSPTVSELAEALGVTQQAASKSVLELEKLGYVERRPDPADSRVRFIALTAKGRAVIARGRAARAKLEADLAAEIGLRAMAQARRAMLALLERTGGIAAIANRRVKPPSR